MSLLEQGIDPIPFIDSPAGFTTSELLQRMSINFKEFTLYKAGLPGYKRSFHRDNAISAFLRADSVMHRNSLLFAAEIQGVKKDPKTGEQPGAIYHEFDVELNGGVELTRSLGFTTLYNASDTTALFLLGHMDYFELTGDATLSEKQQKNIQAAASYVVNHLNDNFEFIEDPKFADARQYALKVTSWKDSDLFGRENGVPSYPVVYPLVHIQNTMGLKAAAKILGSKELMDISLEMVNTINQLFDDNIRNFPLAIDQEGSVKVISTDGLHSLFYLEPSDINREKVIAIINSSKVLETPLGYRVMESKVGELMEDKYHARTIWTHEQAQIHYGASKHLRNAVNNKDRELAKQLLRVTRISSRVYHKFLKENPTKNPEIFDIQADKITPGGNDPQLWAIAARNYFEGVHQASLPLRTN